MHTPIFCTCFGLNYDQSLIFFFIILPGGGGRVQYSEGITRTRAKIVSHVAPPRGRQFRARSRSLLVTISKKKRGLLLVQSWLVNLNNTYFEQNRYVVLPLTFLNSTDITTKPCFIIFLNFNYTGINKGEQFLLRQVTSSYFYVHVLAFTWTILQILST